MAYELKTNTATRIAVGPLVDPGDFKTAETALTVTDLSVQIYQMKNNGTAVVRAQFAPTASAGNNDMALVASSTDGMYDLELTASQLNWLGNGRLTLYDIDGFIVHWIDFQVVSAAYFDWKYGTTIPAVNLTHINGAAQTATLNTIKAETVLILEDTGTSVPATLTTILGDTNELQVNQGNWVTATGFATPTNITAGTITNVTNAPTAGDFTDTMKTSLVTAMLAAGGTGGTTWTYTLTDAGTSAPIAGANVWVTSDLAGTTIIASAVTNASGVATFSLTSGATVYVWRSKSGYNFTNPDTEVVS